MVSLSVVKKTEVTYSQDKQQHLRDKQNGMSAAGLVADR